MFSPMHFTYCKLYTDLLVIDLQTPNIQNYKVEGKLMKFQS